MSPTFIVMLAELERALNEASEHLDDPELAHRLGDDALLRFLRSMTMAIPSRTQRHRLDAALELYERLPRP